MSIEFFFTQQHLTQSAQAQPGKLAVQGDGTQAEGLGLDFARLLFARLDEQNENSDGKNKEDQTPLDSDNPVLSKDPKLDLAQLIANDPEVRQEVEEFAEATGLGDEAALFQALTLNRIVFDNALKSADTDNTPPQEQNILTTDADIIAAEKETAENAPTLFDILTQILSSDDQSANEFAQLIGIADPNAAIQTQKDSTPLEQLAAQLNALVTGGNQQANIQAGATAAATAAPQQNTANKQANQLQTPFAPEGETIPRGEGVRSGEFDIALEDAVKSGKNAKSADIELSLQNTGKNTGNNGQAVANGTAVLQGWPFALTGSLFAAPTGFSEEFYSTPLASSSHSTQIGSLANLVTQAHSAAQPHPATQALAINIQKAVGQGGDRTLTLQLDPPELGRVQVEMQFGKDKSLKAIVTSEKPETHIMLQRDAQTLERLLQDTGLDTENGLNFELAEHGFDFDQDNRRGGGHDNGGTGAGGEDGEQEIIESTMTWHVDPETGHMRYNILV